MEGLLNFIKSPAGQGLLAAVAGGMAGAQRGTPWNNVGRGLLSGIQGYSGALDYEARQAQAAQAAEMQALQRQQLEANLTAQQRQQQEAEAKRKAIEQFIAQANPQQNALANPFAGPEGPSIPQVDPFQQQMFRAMEAGIIPPEQYITATAPKAPQERVLKPGDRVYKGDQLVLDVPERVDANKPFLGIDPATGQPIPNPAYQRYELDKAELGGTRVNVSTKVENKASESVAGQVGPILYDSLTSAEGAMRVGDAADRVITAVNSGNVITGPLANARVTMAQVSQMLGVGGKDEAERLANTRTLVRGLAEMTLQGRKEMSGQGAITDRESALAEKATSGDISNLTAQEIVILAQASKRASQYQMEKHRQKVQAAGNLPGMGNITTFYDIPPMPEIPQVPKATMRYNPQTGKLEEVR